MRSMKLSLLILSVVLVTYTTASAYSIQWTEREYVVGPRDGWAKSSASVNESSYSIEKTTVDVDIMKFKIVNDYDATLPGQNLTASLLVWTYGRVEAGVGSQSAVAHAYTEGGVRLMADEGQDVIWSQAMQEEITVGSDLTKLYDFMWYDEYNYYDIGLVTDVEYELKLHAITTAFAQHNTTNYAWAESVAEIALLNITLSAEPLPSPPAVPEPATMLLVGTGLLGAVGFRNKYKRNCN